MLFQSACVFAKLCELCTTRNLAKQIKQPEANPHLPEAGFAIAVSRCSESRV
jgi:hypothetical protein